MLNPWVALVVTSASALLWLRFNDALAHRGIISSALSRKLIHMGTGPIFVLCWLLFPDIPSARFLAAFVPLMITVQFAMIGFGLIKDKASVDAMSRHGDPKEILRGPLFYGIVFVILTVVYWKDSPIGIIALMLLCGGDGLADVIGKRLTSGALPWSPKKTWGGTMAMFVGGWLFAVIILMIYIAAGVFGGSIRDYLFSITLIALAGTAVESLPFSDIDNISVPALAVLLGHLLLPKG
jgi:phytol kinase